MMKAGEELLVFSGVACSGPGLACVAPLSSLTGRTGEAGAWDSAGAQHAPVGWDRACGGRLMLQRPETADFSFSRDINLSVCSPPAASASNLCRS